MRSGRLFCAVGVALIVAATTVAPVAAAGRHMSTPGPTPNTASYTCVSAHQINYGFLTYGPFGGSASVSLYMSGCWNGSSSYGYAITGSWADWSTGGHGNIPANQESYNSSNPTNYWANVYIGSDWRGVQEWLVPRARLSATGVWSCYDGGGSYWGLVSCG